MNVQTLGGAIAQIGEVGFRLDGVFSHAAMTSICIVLLFSQIGWIVALLYRQRQPCQTHTQRAFHTDSRIALQQYERIISATTDAISLLDRNYVYQFVNDVYLHYNNKQYNEIVGHSVSDLLGQTVFETLVRPKLDECLAGQTIQYEAWFDYPTLGRQFMRITYSPCRESDGTITSVLVSAHNLTQLKQAEEALQRYKRIISDISDGVALVDRNYVYQVVNPAYLNWHQTTEDEVVGFSVSEILGQPIFESVVKPYFDQCLSGQTLQYQAWFTYPDKGNQFVDVTYAPYMDVDQTISGVVVSLRNLTELEQTEEALRQREEQLINAQQIAHVGSWQFNLVTQQRRWSDETFHIFGRDPNLGEPTPEEFFEMVHPDDRADFQTALQRAIAHREQLKVEYRVVKPDGSVRYLETRADPVENSDGQIVQLVGAVLDITDRRQVQKELELQAIITRNMAEGICLVRATDGIFVYANPKFEKMFGYEPGELNGQHVSIINYEDETMDAKEVNRQITAAVTHYGEASYEVRNIKKDGTLIWCRATTSALTHPDYGDVMVAVQQDITDKKQAEAELKASLREKEVLLQEVHHRVKNNLQIVDGLLQLQIRRAKDPQAIAALQDSQSRISSIALVHKKLYGSDNLAKINFAHYIQDLATYLLESYNVEPSQVALTTHVDDISLNIDVAIPCGLIINELISNALKYAFPPDRTGELRIEFCQSDAKTLTLVIQDNGIGLPPSFDLAHIRSLGMTLVQGLVEQLNGRLSFSSQAGTKFKIEFPQENSCL